MCLSSLRETFLIGGEVLLRHMQKCRICCIYDNDPCRLQFVCTPAPSLLAANCIQKKNLLDSRPVPSFPSRKIFSNCIFKMSQPQTEYPCLRQHSNLQPFSQRQNKVELRGDSLTIPALVAVSRSVNPTIMFSAILMHALRCDAIASLDNLPRHVRTQIDDSVKFLMNSLANGHSVYGTFTSVMTQINNR